MINYIIYLSIKFFEIIVYTNYININIVVPIFQCDSTINYVGKWQAINIHIKRRKSLLTTAKVKINNRFWLE